MSQAKKTAGQGAQLLTDVGPVALFILTYFGGQRVVGDDAIFWATGIFIIAMLAALFFARTVHKRWPPMLLASAVIVTIMGGLGILLNDPIFIYVKPTIVNLFLSYLILLGFAFGVNIWKFFFKDVFALPDRIWTILAIRWALFFQFLALLNEFLWRHIVDTDVPAAARWLDGFEITEGLWVNFKLVVMGLSLAFALANIPILLRHQIEDDAQDGE